MKKLLVLGAGFLQKFVIEKAVSMGYHVIAVDKNPNAVGFAATTESAVVDIIDPQACLSFAKAHGIDGVMTAATDYGVLSAAYVAEKLGLPSISYKAAELIKNKYRTRNCLFENRVDDTGQGYEVTEQTNLNVLKHKLIYPVMVKPCDGSGSRAAARVDCESALASACHAAIAASLTKRAEIEPFISGEEYGAESLVMNGEIFVLGIMKKHMTPPPYYAELGHAMPCALAPELYAHAQNCVKKAIKALGINFGAVNMDMLITEDGKVHIIDIGARMGGNLIGSHIIPLGTGIDYLAALIRATLGDKANLTPSAACSAVVTRILALSEGIVTGLPDFKAIEKQTDTKIYHHLSIGDRINPYHTNLDGCGYIVATAENAYAAKEKAERAKSLINQLISRE